MSLYSSLAGTANKLLGKFGQSVTLRRRVVTYTPATGGTSTTTTDTTVNVVVDSYRAERVDGTLVRSTDRRVVVAATGLASAPDAATDVLIIGGVEHRIVSVEPVDPAGTPVVYTVQVRVGQ